VSRVPCHEDHVDVIEFILDNGADVNKQNDNWMTPLHLAIYSKQFSACKLILEYEQVSNQNIESGITISRIAQELQIQSLLENIRKGARLF
jgi:ankyrin repeat protein